MEEKNWFLRASKWEWSPFIVGALAGIGVVAAASEVSLEAAIGGVATILFAWMAVIKWAMK
jgi:hypothetical protein